MNYFHPKANRPLTKTLKINTLISRISQQEKTFINPIKFVWTINSCTAERSLSSLLSLFQHLCLSLISRHCVRKEEREIYIFLYLAKGV